MRTKIFISTLVTIFVVAVTAGPAAAQWVRTYKAPVFPGFCQNS